MRSCLFLLNIGATAALRTTSLGRDALLHPSAASNCISPQVVDISRRAALVISVPVLAAAVLLLRPEGAGASYAMTHAASTTVAFEDRQATPKEMERAVYEEIEVRRASCPAAAGSGTIAAVVLTPPCLSAPACLQASIDEKRPGRPEEGTLGYVGGEYTKRSAQKRFEYEASMSTAEANAASGAGARDQMLSAMLDSM